jgi:HupE / UreJ protein
LKRLLREPLLHFLLLGLALFLLYSLVGERTEGEPGKIVVTQARIDNLVSGFSRVRQRPPTSEELDGLIQDYVREEVYYREAIAIGLDQDDTIIRRRLRQKLEFVSEDVAALPEPTEADLSEFFRLHPDRFRLDSRMSFCHVYLSAERGPERLARDSREMLARLRKMGTEADAASRGDTFLLPNVFDDVPQSEVAAQFGEPFAVALNTVAVGKWEGPLESGYGAHLVLTGRSARYGAQGVGKRATRSGKREFLSDSTTPVRGYDRRTEAGGEPAVEARAMMRYALCILLLLVVFAPQGLAHEVRPAYLELRQVSVEDYEVLWKVPGRGEDLRLGLHVLFPAGTVDASEHRVSSINNAFIERWKISRPGGLAGTMIGIDGLSATLTDALVRLERLDGTIQVSRLTPTSDVFTVEETPSQMQVAITYLRLGVDHILLGFDHLLFVFALLLLVKGGWLLVKTVTAFTVAHSITLALAVFGILQVSQAPVEAAIALSILLLAWEIAQVRTGKPSLISRVPWAVAFGFGLLHGLGFASALRTIGLPSTDVPLALFTFNVGVEVGQLMFVGVVLLVARLISRWNVPVLSPERGRQVLAYGIGTMAAFWLTDRVVSFWA